MGESCAYTTMPRAVTDAEWRGPCWGGQSRRADHAPPQAS